MQRMNGFTRNFQAYYREVIMTEWKHIASSVDLMKIRQAFWTSDVNVKIYTGWSIKN